MQECGSPRYDSSLFQQNANVVTVSLLFFYQGALKHLIHVTNDNSLLFCTIHFNSYYMQREKSNKHMLIHVLIKPLCVSISDIHSTRSL